MNLAKFQNRVEVVYDPRLKTDIVFRNNWIPNFLARQIGKTWFIANASGNWLLLNEEEFKQVRSVGIPFQLYQKLERESLILTQSNNELFLDLYKHWTAPHFRHPVHHILITTLRCNLSCSYCHANVVPSNAGKAYDLSIDTADSILEFAINSKAEVQSFEFQGGESLLNKETLKYIIPKIRREYNSLHRHVYFSIQTNATLLNDDMYKFLKDNEVSIGTSIDGPIEVHDRQRTTQTNGTFELVNSISKKYNLPFLATITKNSVPFWKDIIDIQLQNGNTVLAFNNVYPINSARKNWEEVGIKSSEYLSLYKEVAEYLKSMWSYNYYPMERRMYLAFKKLITKQDVDFADFGSPCGMVHSQIAYNHNGDVYTCDEGRDFPEFRLGNVVRDSYDEVVFGEKMRYLKSLSIPNDVECMSCAYRAMCSTCPVYDRAVNGELTARHAGTDKCFQTKLIFDMVIGWIKDDVSLIKNVGIFYKIKFHEVESL